MTCALLCLLGTWWHVAGAQEPLPLTTVTAPVLVLRSAQPVEVGHPIELVLTLHNARDITGYDIKLRFDPVAAHIQQLTQHLEVLNRELGLIATPDGVAFGAYRCPAPLCIDDRQALRRTPSHPEFLTLATLFLMPDRAGPLVIEVAQAVVVDSSGRRFDARAGSPAVVLQVALAHVPFPAVSSSTDTTNTTIPLQLAGILIAPADRRAMDLTGDGRVNSADLMEVALARTDAQARSTPCHLLAEAHYDLNADSCLDVADLLQVAGAIDPPALPATRFDGPYRLYLPTLLTFTLAWWTVNSTGDQGDVAIRDGICATAAGECTLRAAIQEANAHPGPDNIQFNVPGSGVQTIQLSSRLPTLSDTSGGTLIDGYTQPGATPNTDPVFSHAIIRVEIAGVGEAGFSGLPITSSGNIIRGLAFYRLRHALWLYGRGAHDNLIVGTFIGTDAAGHYGAAANEYLASGIMLEQGAARNRIGGPTPAERNVISGNAFSGIALYHRGTNDNVMINNVVGLEPRGNQRLTNQRHGIDLNFGASSNRIGGFGPNEGNIVSGNSKAGIELSHGADTCDNHVLGNRIGTDGTGTRATAYSTNDYVGVHLNDGVTDNVVAGNVIGNNRMGGIDIVGYGTSGNHLHENWIGISLDGSAVPNGHFGIGIGTQAERTQIGPGNVIANNLIGIQIREDAQDFNTITQNAIFANSELGIDLGPRGVNLNDQYGHDGPNQGLPFPNLSGATLTHITGTACMSCTVELFQADRGANHYGQGKTWLGSATVGPTGTFTATVNGLTPGDSVTATATDAVGNTSEFARNRQVRAQMYFPRITL